MPHGNCELSPCWGGLWPETTKPPQWVALEILEVAPPRKARHFLLFSRSREFVDTRTISEYGTACKGFFYSSIFTFSRRITSPAAIDVNVVR